MIGHSYTYAGGVQPMGSSSSRPCLSARGACPTILVYETSATEATSLAWLNCSYLWSALILSRTSSRVPVKGPGASILIDARATANLSESATSKSMRRAR